MSLHAKCIAGVAFAALSAASASAGIVISTGNAGSFNDENVLFNETGLLASGPLVQGATSPSGIVVDFFGAGENLVTPALGQARIEAADGAFNALTIALNTPGATFATLIFNIDICDSRDLNNDGNVTINVTEQGGPGLSATFSVDENGQNFFSIEAINGQAITSVNFVTDVPICAVRQVRIGGMQGAVAVPLPAAALSGGSLLAISAIVRRVRRQY